MLQVWSLSISILLSVTFSCNLVLKFFALTDEQCLQYHEMAMFHREVNQVDEFDLIDKTVRNKHFQSNFVEKVCPCCKLGLGAKMKFGIDINELKELGAGVILFFYHLKNSIFICCCRNYSIIQGMINNGIDYYYRYYSTSECGSSIYCTIQQSLNAVNVFDDKRNLQIGSMVALIWTLIHIIAVRVIEGKGVALAEQIQENAWSPADFSIKIEHLPAAEYTETELINFLLQKCKQDHLEVEIVRIFIQYDLSSVNKILKSMEQQSIVLRKLVQQRKESLEPGQDLLEKIQLLKHQFKLQLIQLENFSREFITKEQFRKSLISGCCVIQFKTHTMREQFLNRYGTEKIPVLQMWYYKLKYFVLKISERIVYFKDSRLDIYKAPEPEDIIWPNCRHQSTIRTTLAIWLISCMVIFAVFTLNLMLFYLQSIYKQVNAGLQSWFYLFIEVIVSLFTIVLNKVLNYSINFITDQQQLHSSSEIFISRTQKLIVYQCFNVIVLPVISNTIFSNHPQQTVQQVSTIVLNYAIVNAIVENIGTFLSASHVMQMLAIHTPCIRNRIIKYYAYFYASLKENNTHNLNKFYEGQDIDLINSYAFNIVTLLHMSFFGYLQPLIVLIGSISILINYNAKKYLLLTRYKTPLVVQHEIFSKLIVFLKMMPLFYGIGVLYVFSQLDVNRNLSQNLSEIYLYLIITLSIFDFINPGFILDKIVRILQNCTAKVQPIDNKHSSLSKVDLSEFKYYQNYHLRNSLLHMFGFFQYLVNQRPQLDVYEEYDIFLRRFESNNYEPTPVKRPRYDQQQVEMTTARKLDPLMRTL